MSLLPLLLYTSITALVIYLLLNLRTPNRKPLPPGPTPWPIVGNLPHLGPIPHHSLAALATKYGPLMHLRLGFVDVVVAASASVAAQFLKTHDANFASRPPNSGAKHIAYDYHDLVFAPYGPRWRMLRKICSVHLFSAKALDDFRHVRQVSRVFGDGDPKADEFKDMVVELMVLAGEFNIGDFIPAVDWLDLQGVTKKMKKLHARFDSFLNTILEEHKSGNSTGDDVIL
ncbi:hypothetical protein E3N88_15520 [Mikania micrantha]|uniref:Flavonoid 3'-hydroxylase n=1 Tax=Mikania micrantha TaxID=192012 RepID=A0A5N6NVM7_9ASTR|nr:hypothetical protein E3N88_15520 [Mikania micrantha]